MKKTIFALMLSIVMIFTFTACGGNADDSPITSDEINELYTDPDNFKGRTFEFTGSVLDVEKDGSDLYIQVYYDIKNYDKNTIVVYPDADVSLKTEDFIRVKGTIDGTFEGENYLGSSIEVPKMTASKVEKIDAMEAFPANKTVEVNKTVKKGNYVATISKVDFTDDETRIYLKVENNGSGTFDNYPDQGVIVQDGKQYDTEWNEYYPEPSTELRAGATSESVIAFKKIDEVPFEFSFTGYDDVSYDEIEFVFNIDIE